MCHFPSESWSDATLEDTSTSLPRNMNRNDTIPDTFVTLWTSKTMNSVSMMLDDYRTDLHSAIRHSHSLRFEYHKLSSDVNVPSFVDLTNHPSIKNRLPERIHQELFDILGCYEWR